MALIKVSQAMGSTPSIIDGGNATAITINSSEEVTFAAKITAVGTSIFTDLDISGDIDVDGTTNLDAVDIDGAVNMATTALVTGVLTANGGAVFNEASADVDFRVESNGNANMLFVDGGNNRVGIGTNSPNFPLQLDSNRADATFDANNLSTWADFKIQGDTASGNARGIYFDFDLDTGDDRGAGIVGISGDAGGGVGSLAFITTAGNVGAERVRIDSSGNVGIGTTNPAQKFVVQGSNHIATLLNTSTTANDYSQLLLQAGSSQGYIWTQNQNSTAYGGANSLNIYTQQAAPIAFFTNANNERMRIDASGNVLVGKTTTALATAGLAFGGTGFASLTRSGATALNINRLTNDGDWITAYKAGTALGHIGTYGGTAYIGSANGGIMFNGVAIEPTSGEQARADNTINLGSANYRFKDLVLGDGIFLGGTGAANKLNDYESGTWTPIIQGDGATVSGQQYGTRVAKYTKIGSFVFLTCDVGLTTLGTTNGSYANIKGLPFSVVVSHMGGGSVGYYSGISNHSGVLTFYAAANQVYLMPGGASYVPRTDLTNSSRVIATIIYQTGQ